jgi:AAA domain/Bifunctional DNA primase/polymerase, N-terminal
MTGPYGAAARRYHAAGWSPLPLPARKKKPPPAGWTGKGAQKASAADVEAWCEDHPAGNIGLWLPPGTVGIDADVYKGPAEAAAWDELVGQYGPLPDGAPWCTSRDDGVSGIRLLAVPDDYEAVTDLGLAGEVIQHFHRYVVAPPSIHPDTGKPYRWINTPQGRLPDAGKLPPLPPAWLEGLRARNPAAPDGAARTGWTDPDIDALIEQGIPAGDPRHDDRLRDVVWKLHARQESKPVIRSVWQAIVTRTPLKDPAHPWTAADFERHWQGASRKQGNLIFRPPGGQAADAETTGSDDGLAALREIAGDFTPVDWHAAWDAKPEDIQWLIEPLIEAGQSVALYATPGTGKSLIALECAAALATGRAVLGNPAGDPVTVVYIDVENREPSLVERLQAFGYKPADLSRLVLYSFPSIAALDSLLGGQQILALAVSNGAAIVIIDTTSRVVAGKENDADTYLAFYRHTVIPLRARGIAMLRLDHPGKDVTRGTRGSSAKKGDVDAEWLLSRTSELTFVLDRQKERENHGAAWLNLRRRFEPLRHDVSVTGLGGRAGEIAAQLDQLDVPPGSGRMIAAKALREAGIKFTNADLAAALRWRKRSADLDRPPPPPTPAEPIRPAPDRSDRSVSDPDEPHRSVPPTQGYGSADRSAPDEGALAVLGDAFGQLTILSDDVQAQTGPCARCRKPCKRYGDDGRPLCDDCIAMAS